MSVVLGNSLRDQRALKKADQKYAGQIQRIIDGSFKKCACYKLGVFVPILPTISADVLCLFYAVEAVSNY